jgi:hypothetical protein
MNDDLTIPPFPLTPSGRPIWNDVSALPQLKRTISQHAATIGAWGLCASAALLLCLTIAFALKLWFFPWA